MPALPGAHTAKRTPGQGLPPRGCRKPPSQTWRTFLRNHVGQIAAIELFTVPTAMFEVLCVFVVSLDRRRVVRFDVMDAPGAVWTAQVGGLHHRYERCAA